MSTGWAGKPWLAPALLGLLFALAVADPLAYPDRLWFDWSLRTLMPLRPAAEQRIIHLDIEQQDVTAWSNTQEEYAGLASIIQSLKDEGAQVVAADLLISRGKKEDFQSLWEQFDSNLVVGRTLTENTRPAPAGQPQAKTGLMLVAVDDDGLIRHYDWARRDPKSGIAYPSLALQTYLAYQGVTWKPEFLVSDRELVMDDVDSTGKTIQRRLPNRVLLDQRAIFTTESDRNFQHLTPRKLAEWKAQPGLVPRLEGDIVLVGYTAPGTGDIGSTPLNKAIPKVVIHAMAINDLFQDSWHEPAPRRVDIVLGLLVLSLGGLLASHLSGWKVLVVGLLGAAAISAGGWALLLRSHWVLDAGSLTLLWGLAIGFERMRQVRLRHARSLGFKASADMEDLLILKSVGPYQIVERIGRGGFATVYRGLLEETLDPEHPVAIKIINPDSAASAEYRNRFMREIRISGQLHHESIVRVLESGDQNGMLYLAMELVVGRPLRYFMERRLEVEARWSAEEAMQVVLPVMRGMAYAHAMSVLHRDLKPENVMVCPATPSENGPWNFTTVKIVDFGLAFDSHSTQLTKTDELFGTLDYLAPERIQGVKDDPRSDQYAVGVLAYELLAGRSPFPQQTTAETLLFRLTANPTPLRELRPDLPLTLLAVIEKMMERDPEKRFATIQDALQALEVR